MPGIPARQEVSPRRIEERRQIATAQLFVLWTSRGIAATGAPGPSNLHGLLTRGTNWHQMEAAQWRIGTYFRRIE
jgi:hypothetical protein